MTDHDVRAAAHPPAAANMARGPGVNGNGDGGRVERPGEVTPAVGAPATDLPPVTAAVVTSLWRTEGRLLLRHPAVRVGVAVGLFLVWLTSQNGYSRWSDLSLELPLFLVPFGWAALLGANVGALRDRRHGTAELFDTCPAHPGARTEAQVLATLWLVPVAAGLVGVALALHTWVWAPMTGSVLVSELAHAPLLVVGGAVVGIAVARWLPHPAWGVPAVVATILLQNVLSDLLGDAARRLAFLFETPRLGLPDLVVRRTGWHLLWVGAWVAIMGLVAVSRQTRGRAVAVAAAGTIGVASVSGAALARPLDADDVAAMRSLLVEPVAHQVCERHGGAQLCAYRGNERVLAEWRDRVDGVLARVPEPVPASALVVTQRPETIIGSESCGDSPFLDEVDPALRRAVSPEEIWPRDGAVHPGLEGDLLPCGGARLDWLYLSVSLGAWAVGLPPSPWHDDQRCVADGQARSVLALWLGAQAVPHGAQHLRTVGELMLEDPHGRASFGDGAGGAGDPFTVHPQWGVHWHLSDVDAALALLEQRPAADVAAVVASSWDVLVDPATPAATLLDLIGVEAPSALASVAGDCPEPPGGRRTAAQAT